MKRFEMPCSINCKYANELLNQIIEQQKEIKELREKIFQLQHNEDDCISYEKACLDTLDNYDK